MLKDMYQKNVFEPYCFIHFVNYFDLILYSLFIIQCTERMKLDINKMKISVLKADQVCFIKLVRLLENEISMINLHPIYTHTYFVLGTITGTNIKIDVDD